MLFLPFTGPAKGFTALARHVVREAERSLYDEDALRDALLELDLQENKMSDEERVRREEELMARLGEVRESRPGA